MALINDLGALSRGAVLGDQLAQQEMLTKFQGMLSSLQATAPLYETARQIPIAETLATMNRAQSAHQLQQAGNIAQIIEDRKIDLQRKRDDEPLIKKQRETKLIEEETAGVRATAQQQIAKELADWDARLELALKKLGAAVAERQSADKVAIAQQEYDVLRTGRDATIAQQKAIEQQSKQAESESRYMQGRAPGQTVTRGEQRLDYQTEVLRLNNEAKKAGIDVSDAQILLTQNQAKKIADEIRVSQQLDPLRAAQISNMLLRNTRDAAETTAAAAAAGITSRFMGEILTDLESATTPEDEDAALARLSQYHNAMGGAYPSMQNEMSRLVKRYIAETDDNEKERIANEIAAVATMQSREFAPLLMLSKNGNLDFNNPLIRALYPEFARQEDTQGFRMRGESGLDVFDRFTGSTRPRVPTDPTEAKDGVANAYTKWSTLMMSRLGDTNAERELNSSLRTTGHLLSTGITAQGIMDLDRAPSWLGSDVNARALYQMMDMPRDIYIMLADRSGHSGLPTLLDAAMRNLSKMIGPTRYINAKQAIIDGIAGNPDKGITGQLDEYGGIDAVRASITEDMAVDPTTAKTPQPARRLIRILDDVTARQQVPPSPFTDFGLMGETMYMERLGLTKGARKKETIIKGRTRGAGL